MISLRQLLTSFTSSYDFANESAIWFRGAKEKELKIHK